MTPSMKQRLLLFVGAPVFFFVCFGVFAYLTFPYDHVRDYIIQEVEAPKVAGGKRRASGWVLQMESLRPSFLTGVVAEKVQIGRAPKSADEKPALIDFDEVHGRVSLLSLFAGDRAFSFGGTLGEGEIEGTFEQADTHLHVVADLENVPLDRFGLLRAYFSLPVTGVVSGHIDLLIAEQASATTGSIELTVDSLSIGDGKAELKPPGAARGLVVERVVAGKVEIAIKVTEGLAKIERFSVRGRDIELNVWGSLRLQLPFAMSRRDIFFRFRPTDAYKQRNERTRTLLELLEFNQTIARAKNPEGFFTFRWAGTFAANVSPTAAADAKPPTP